MIDFLVFFGIGFLLVLFGAACASLSGRRVVIAREPRICPFCGSDRVWVCLDGCRESMTTEAVDLRRWKDRGDPSDRG